ncbi:MAG: fasciclin domain-containing protein [Hymenobacteraceae bacterium]|nr:fasciclin domain-containing protein [Hymenobacteraceae bacterium]
MKTQILHLLSSLAVASAMLSGCAGSRDETGEATTAETTTMSETQAMAGDVERSVAPELDYDDLFKDVGNTAQYNLVELARQEPNLTTFVTLVQTAGLTEILEADGAFTVFAPTNAAFAQLPQPKLDSLMQPENKAQLLRVLQLHVLPSRVASTEFQENQRIETADNEYLYIDVNDATRAITIGGANVVKPDVEASNGILHVVDGVITTTTEERKY